MLQVSVCSYGLVGKIQWNVRLGAILSSIGRLSSPGKMDISDPQGHPS